MTDIEGNVSDHFLFPSTIFVDRSPFRVQTVLGSCVAVCMYDAKLGFGGINHYMMPWWNGEGIPSPHYGNVANDLLVRKLEALGASKKNMVAKVFGGASQHIRTGRLSVGERNVNEALSFLEKNRIQLAGKSVGGDKGRKIVFYTGTGQVFMKMLESQI